MNVIIYKHVGRERVLRECVKLTFTPAGFLTYESADSEPDFWSWQTYGIKEVFAYE